MIDEPGRYAEQFVSAGARMVSVHVEADAHIHRTLMSIKKAGAQAGVVLNPATALSAVEEAIGYADYVLLMSVNPGFGGQEFIPGSIERLRTLRRMIESRGLPTRIEIDGGIDQGNIEQVVAAGAEIIVAGSAIFGAEDPEAAARKLREVTVEWV
jgi:ribulose-phosphate 3-epimerase